MASAKRTNSALQDRKRKEEKTRKQLEEARQAQQFKWQHARKDNPEERELNEALQRSVVESHPRRLLRVSDDSRDASPSRGEDKDLREAIERSRQESEAAAIVALQAAVPFEQLVEGVCAESARVTPTKPKRQLEEEDSSPLLKQLLKKAAEVDEKLDRLPKRIVEALAKESK